MANEQAAREHQEPSESGGALSPIILVLMGALSYFAITYVVSATNGDPYGYGGDHRSLYTAAQVELDGEGLFGQHCAACHQTDGLGVGGAFPPLDGSSWVTQDGTTPARILLRGLNGPIVVQGETYDNEMPSFAKLEDDEIAKIVTYIRGAWSNDASEVSTADVEDIRASLADAPARPWRSAELEAARGR